MTVARAIIKLVLIQLYIWSARGQAEEAKCEGVLLLDLPVRYLHIQLLRNGQNLTSSVGKLQVSVQGSCRHRWDVVDNFDGSYVLRIRLWSQCPKLLVSIKSPNGASLCGSPITIEKENGYPLYPETCDCASENLDKWMERAQCPTRNEQLDLDLEQWKEIDFALVLQTVETSWGSDKNKYSFALCYYKVVNNEVYRRCFGAYTDFRQFVDKILTSIARKMWIPDTEFIFNLGDYPLERNLSNGVPIVAWCGSNDTKDIAMPTYEVTDSVVDAMYKTNLDIHTAKGKTHWPWDIKKTTAVFRGRDSNKLRLKIAALAKKQPELIEGGITRYFFFNESLYTPPVEHRPFSEFFKHKIILSIDGTVAAYRFPFLLAGDSVIFKSESRYYEHFYSLLKPGLHYIPFSSSDAIQKLESARDQDFNQTITAMKQFVLDHLQPRDIYCYYADFLKKYTAKLKRPPTQATEGMDHVAKSSPHNSCSCISREAKRSNSKISDYKHDDL